MVRSFITLVRGYLSLFTNLPLSGSIDLSKATELKHLVLACESDPQWSRATTETFNGSQSWRLMFFMVSTPEVSTHPTLYT